jgi:hypothetical protein
MSKPGIVFAHGLLAGGFSFNEVIPVLQQKGLAVVSAENPLNSLESDVHAVRHALARVGGPRILVGDYSRSRGLFAGVNLKGVVIRAEEDLKKGVYHKSARTLLGDNDGAGADSEAGLPPFC